MRFPVLVLLLHLVVTTACCQAAQLVMPLPTKMTTKQECARSGLYHWVEEESREFYCQENFTGCVCRLKPPCEQFTCQLTCIQYSSCGWDLPTRSCYLKQRFASLTNCHPTPLSEYEEY